MKTGKLGNIYSAAEINLEFSTQGYFLENPNIEEHQGQDKTFGTRGVRPQSVFSPDRCFRVLFCVGLHIIF